MEKSETDTSGSGDLKGKIYNTILLIIVLYAFLLSIKLLGTALKTSFAANINEWVKSMTLNPFMGLMLGVLVTSILQSSSATTSIVVSMVAMGPDVLPLQNAIPIVMGANIGTSVTNTLVSLGHITRRDEFRRAFSAAVIHDTFNIMCVTFFFPLEIMTGYLRHLSSGVSKLVLGSEEITFASPLDWILKPVTSNVKHFYCVTLGCGSWGGIIVLIISIGLLVISLTQFSRMARQIFIGKLSVLFDKFIFRNAVLALTMGLIITATIQSSSITTSLCVPLAAAGVLTVEQIFPFTIGSNIGTTITAFLASLAAGEAGITIAFAHLFFNISGGVLFYPVPQIRRIPLRIAKYFGSVVATRRSVALYLISGVFFLIPGISLLVYSLLGG